VRQSLKSIARRDEMRGRRVWGAAIATAAAGFLAIAATVSSAGSNTVTMRDDFFEPRKTSVGQGDKVTWVNEGQSDHTVKFEGEKNKVVSPGEQTGRRFKQTGKFKYACTLHPDMVGKVVVKG
jgi:plastocyanin